MELGRLICIVYWFEKQWAKINSLTVQDRAVQVGLIRQVEYGGVQPEGVQRRRREDKGMQTRRFRTKRRDRARRVRQKLGENSGKWTAGDKNFNKEGCGF